MLRLLAQGLNRPEVAQKLYISARTVEKHVQHVLTKLGVRTRVEAVAFAARNRILDDGM